MRIGDQIVETLQRAPRRRPRRSAPARAGAGGGAIDDPERVRAGLYPHEVSGGMGQRAMIAMMLVAGPSC